MLRKLMLALFMAPTMGALAQAAPGDGLGIEDLNNKVEPPTLGIHWSRDTPSCSLQCRYRLPQLIRPEGLPVRPVRA
ncbi:MAG: hypothetical protein JO218_17155 [Burkholderiales bacterium]|nr:hypothetical protein [Burkholderiales bacterium]